MVNFFSDTSENFERLTERKMCSASLDLSDEKLLMLCKKYGSQSKLWRQKFLGLLPEVARRGLWRRAGFSSVFEFAAKTAGVSQEQVRTVLRIEQKFANKPVLRGLLVNGGVSVNKLARVVSVATMENQDILADQVQLLPQKALEVLVKDMRIAAKLSDQSGQQVVNDGDSGLNPGQGALFGEQSQEEFSHKGCRDLRAQKVELLISESTLRELLELQKMGIDIDALIREKLEQRRAEIIEEKELILEKQIVREERWGGCLDGTVDEMEGGKRSRPAVGSRYIPQRIRRVLQKEHGNKCAIQACQKPSEEIHHTQRFALSREHNPYFMAPLCREHHLIAQSVDVRFHQVRRGILGARVE